MPNYDVRPFRVAVPDSVLEDLRQRLSSTALTICKGDANYRRLCSDAHWPRSTPFADVVGYFPSPVAALRTLKSELIVGMQAARAAELDESDPGWLTSGRYGVVQAHLG